MALKVINIISYLGAGLFLALSHYSYAAKNLVEDGLPPAKLSVLDIKTPMRLTYNINPKLLVIVALAKSAPESAEIKLQNANLTMSQLNVAEQYVYLLIKGKIKQHYQQHQHAIEILEQAKYLSEKIVEQQLNSPVFADLHCVLAHSFIAINDFENAYHAKKLYIEKFNKYSDVKRDETIALLTEKYEIAHKVEANKLLDNESKLKALQINDIEKKQQHQQRNFILIFCGILVFLLLLFRQFKFRKKLLLLKQTDSLTGLLNRGALFLKGQALVKRSLEPGKSLSVLLVDVDHFKQVNDDYGHQIGDLVLIEIAKLVNETMRARDVFARLGGEEFVILLPDTDIDKAKGIAVRVIEKICQHHFAHLGVNRPVTLSIGVVDIHDTTAAFDDLIHAADLAMYQAKKQGRNQMVNYATIAQDKERRVMVSE